MEMEGMPMPAGNETCPHDSMMSMRTSFFFGHQCSLLFSSFNLETPGQLFGGVILVMLVAVLYEGLKTLREVLASYEAKQSAGGVAINANSDNTPLVSPSQTQAEQHKSLQQFFLHDVVRGYCNSLHLLQSWLHVVQVGVAYLLMLVAMTFNGWLFLAACFGAGLGYFVFGKCRKSFSDFRSQSEHCH